MARHGRQIQWRQLNRNTSNTQQEQTFFNLLATRALVFVPFVFQMTHQTRLYFYVRAVELTHLLRQFRLAMLPVMFVMTFTEAQIKETSLAF